MPPQTFETKQEAAAKLHTRNNPNSNTIQESTPKAKPIIKEIPEHFFNSSPVFIINCVFCQYLILVCIILSVNCHTFRKRKPLNNQIQVENNVNFWHNFRGNKQKYKPIGKALKTEREKSTTTKAQHLHMNTQEETIESKPRCRTCCCDAKRTGKRFIPIRELQE